MRCISLMPTDYTIPLKPKNQCHDPDFLATGFARASSDAYDLASKIEALKNDAAQECDYLEDEVRNAFADNCSLQIALAATAQCLLAVCEYYSQPSHASDPSLAELVAGLYERGYIFVPDPSIERMREKRTP